MAAPKVLEILQLFTVEAPRWRVDRLAEQMGVSSSTAYRCVAELVRTGFLQPVAGGAYVLGPAFAEYDLRMRLSDPLLRAGLPHLRRLRRALDEKRTTAFLARYYRDRIMFVHIERAGDMPSEPGRGQQISLFSRAAVARAVLFALPDRMLRTLYQRHPAEISVAGLGESSRDFRAHVKQLRERGWATARSAVVAGRVGIAAPVVSEGAVRGSLGVSLPEPLADAEIQRIAPAVVAEAARIAADLGRDADDAPRLLGRHASGASRTAQGVPLQ